VKAYQVMVFADEMRIGLHGQGRRRWTPRGFKLRQKVELEYVWRYLVLAVAPKTGRLLWRWTHNVKKEATQEVVQKWKEQGVKGIIWDRAPSHRSRLVKEVGVHLVSLPAYSPELNPAERVFQEIRRAVEGIVYDGEIEKKVEAVEAFLNGLAADPERVRRLAGWSWIQEALSELDAA